MDGDAKPRKGLTDYGTIIGLCAGGALIAWSMCSSTDIGAFFHLPSLAMVVGGSLCAAIISVPLRNIREFARVIRTCFMDDSKSTEQVIAEMVEFADVARRDGVLALEERSRSLSDPFLVSALHMVVDGVDAEQMQGILEAELNALENRHADGRSILENIGRFAPAFGMIGTFLGMVVMLRDMTNPARIGPSMAVALLTALYGAAIANLVALPLADKLTRRTRHEIVLKTIVIRGALAIIRGDNPRVVEQKLSTFLRANERGRTGDHRRAA
ncbi:MAG: MotA/TolQ/ExbB proton channel family protein [Planctomycetes bacterium]|nr:MotA/TolQ/ExbB proton channel family protein [Planctomycetota bacterium]MBI3835296.1 MotA/TolQ/ExbB proton channel family protein [Planctomycetota bacterium]